MKQADLGRRLCLKPLETVQNKLIQKGKNLQAREVCAAEIELHLNR